MKTLIPAEKQGYRELLKPMAALNSQSVSVRVIKGVDGATLPCGCPASELSVSHVKTRPGMFCKFPDNKIGNPDWLKCIDPEHYTDWYCHQCGTPIIQRRGSGAGVR